MGARILCGDVIEMLTELPDRSVQTVVTSPPYYGLRDYGIDGQIGLESTPQAYINQVVAVFAEVRRVLRDDGTVWLNLGDSYAGSGKGGNPDAGKQATNKGSQSIGVLYGKTGASARRAAVTNVTRRTFEGIKAKDLLGIPWMAAFALRDDGWYLRSDIIWAKPNPMTESVKDRPTRAHEYVFLLTKSARYYYDADAIKEPYAASTVKEAAKGYRGQARKNYDGARAQNPSDTKRRIVESIKKQRGHGRRHAGFNDRWDRMTKEEQQRGGANKRDVWWISPQPFKGSHFATFPEKLVEPCILAGSAPGDTVLDPFCGSGRAGIVATRLGREFIGIDLNPEYCTMAICAISEVEDRCA